jgi:hypothetical protein
VSAASEESVAVVRADAVPASIPGRAARRQSLVLRSLQGDRAAVLGLLLVAVWLGMALVGPLVMPGDPNDQVLRDALTPPVWDAEGVASHPFGTDHLGRDILVRIVHGARTSLVIGVSAVGLAIVIGSLAGVVAAEWGGRVDEIIMRLADIQLAIPFILLAIAVLALLGGSIPNMIVVLILAGWVIFARVVRSEVLHLREMEFILAARTLGTDRPETPAAECDRAGDRDRDARARERHHPGGGAELPRRGGTAAPSKLGCDARRRPRLPDRGVVVGHDAGSHDHADYPGGQPRRRLDPRYPRSSPAQGLSDRRLPLDPHPSARDGEDRQVRRDVRR